MEPVVVTGRDIVIVGQQAWDTEIGSNCKNIAIEFSKHNRVLYVNAALDRITLLRNYRRPFVEKRRKIICGKEDGLLPIAPNLWNLYPDVLVESINWINSPFIFDILNKRNGKRFARSIVKAMQTLNFKNIILFNDNDMFKSRYLKELLHPAISIYYSRDFMLAVDYWKKHGERIEPELIRTSDICTANSVYLADYCRQYNKNSYYVGQGCDFDIFSGIDQLSVPDSLQKIERPIIGYVGALQHIRLDIEIIGYIAKAKPEWQIVLVGPEDEIFRKSELHEVKNIHFLGPKKAEELPQYIKAFDVCINPQLVNEVTIGNYPRKIDEYLATGKPVVATRTQALSIFEEYIYLADTKEQYITFIECALKEDSGELAQKRKQFAHTHTWESSVGEIYKAINNFEK